MHKVLSFPLLCPSSIIYHHYLLFFCNSHLPIPTSYRWIDYIKRAPPVVPWNLFLRTLTLKASHGRDACSLLVKMFQEFSGRFHSCSSPGPDGFYWQQGRSKDRVSIKAGGETAFIREKSMSSQTFTMMSGQRHPLSVDWTAPLSPLEWFMWSTCLYISMSESGSPPLYLPLFLSIFLSFYVSIPRL